MAIAHDWLEPTDTKDVSETQFVDQLLEGWAKWARNTGVDQRPTQAGDLWQIQTIIEATTHILELSDDAFTLVDQKIAHLPRRLHGIVFVEYMGHGSTEQKAVHIGLNRLGYRQRLHAAQWALFAALTPHIHWKEHA